LEGDIKMETLHIYQKPFYSEHGKLEIETVDIFGSMTYILACVDIIVFIIAWMA
jgi:hypothetical protein